MLANDILHHRQLNLTTQFHRQYNITDLPVAMDTPLIQSWFTAQSLRHIPCLTPARPALSMCVFVRIITLNSDSVSLRAFRSVFIKDTQFLNAGSFFSSAPSASALSHRSAATAGTFGARQGAQDSNKTNTLYILHKTHTSEYAYGHYEDSDHRAGIG